MKPITDFFSIVQRANLRKDNDVRLTIDEANKLHTAISVLLARLTTESDSPTVGKILGGKKFSDK